MTAPVHYVNHAQTLVLAVLFLAVVVICIAAFRGDTREADRLDQQEIDDRRALNKAFERRTP